MCFAQAMIRSSRCARQKRKESVLLKEAVTSIPSIAATILASLVLEYSTGDFKGLS